VVLVVGIIVAMTVLAVMVFDAGFAMSDRRNLQTYADAAALAGARSYGPGADAAHYVALEYLTSPLGFSLPFGACGSTANCSAGTYYIGNYRVTLADSYRYQGIFNYPTVLDVVIVHTQPSIFARMVGFNTLTVAASARATTPGPQFNGANYAVAAVNGDALINGGGSGSTRDARLAVGLAIAAGVCFGAFFVLYHAGSGGGVVAFLSGRVASGMIAIAFALVSRVSPIPEVKAWRLILIAGTLDGAGVVLYLYATFHGLLSLTALLTSFYPAFTILAARFVLRERLAPRQAAGALLAIVAVALIAAA
jgi:drug/metabolite transporter (DMT)-like permease